MNAKVVKNNPYRVAHYVISAHRLNQLPADGGIEVAFAGRSNAGKSSAINALTEQKSLARTSKTPGRTQLINFFSLDGSHRLVDLPGYGYAKVSKQVRQQWDALLDDYLRSRQSLVGLVLLMDCRHPLKEFDMQFIQWCNAASLRLHILLTKSDKLKRGAANDGLRLVKSKVGQVMPGASVQLFSALNRSGVDSLVSVLDSWLNIKQNND